MMLSSKPKKRSRLRRWAGQHYFTWKRTLSWYKSSTRFTTTKSKTLLPYSTAQHSTPLFRKLRGVDMWMQKNKVTNLTLAAQCIHGILLHPGEVFSFWRLVGKPTAKKGYLRGMVLCEGSFYAATGGGLCQLANLVYWLTLHTPLSVTERWRHSYDIFPDSDRTQPFGSGATVAYNYIDLQITNHTASTYQLSLWLDETYLHGRWLSQQPQDFTYQVYEADHHVTHEWWGGYMRHNTLRRKVIDRNGQEIKDEHVTENHAIMMYQPFLHQ
jgi:vancomycin resistance protein VanW